MRYKKLDVIETLNIPSFGIMPIVIIKKGTTKNNCIIGFTDKKEVFKEYEMVAIKNDQLKLIGLKSYFIGVYQAKIK